MSWVEGSSSSAAAHIRQTSHPALQVTGGALIQPDLHSSYLLIFGQNFTGYYTVGSNGEYTQTIRTFQIVDTGRSLSVVGVTQSPPNPNYRRRDLNILPTLSKSNHSLIPGAVALSGVFTPNLNPGVWTVPVLINADGTSFMQDPASPSTFKQGINNYDCARVTLYSKKTNDNYMLLFGGISYLGEMLDPDPVLPFVNTVTTVQIDPSGNFQQYLMDAAYPTILSTFSNPGNTLLFGAEARFIPADQSLLFPNGALSLDAVGSSPTLLGYIVGGIQSTLPNTSVSTDTAASPYIFQVMIEK
jgi:hypothetical protein